MQTITIAQGGGYRLDSHGNGWAYTLHAAACDPVWIQDDDASIFREQFDAMQQAAPWRPYADILADLYREYRS